MSHALCKTCLMHLRKVSTQSACMDFANSLRSPCRLTGSITSKLFTISKLSVGQKGILPFD